MTDKTNIDKAFNLKKCRAKMYGAGGLVCCLTPEQVKICRNSLHFGNVDFCNHPLRNEIIESVKKLKIQSGTFLNALQPDESK